jgi:hypothetical protein
MEKLSRRAFMKATSAAAVAVGTISAVPGAGALVGTVEAEAPADTETAEATTADVEAAGALRGPVVAHFNPETGETALYAGTREVVVKNPRLASHLARALR